MYKIHWGLSRHTVRLWVETDGREPFVDRSWGRWVCGNTARWHRELCDWSEPRFCWDLFMMHFLVLISSLFGVYWIQNRISVNLSALYATSSRLNRLSWFPNQLSDEIHLSEGIQSETRRTDWKTKEHESMDDEIIENWSAKEAFGSRHFCKFFRSVKSLYISA